MSDFVTNAQISVPLYTGLSADVDLGGLKFNYQHGIFYEVSSTFIPIKLPPPWPANTPSTGGAL